MGDVLIRPQIWQPSIRHEIRHGDDAIARFEHAWLRERLLALPLLERAIIVWHYGIGVQALDVAEIADRLAIPVGRVIAIRQTALARLHPEAGPREAA